MKLNVASQVVDCQLNSRTDGSPVTTGTTTVYVSGDGGPQVAAGGSPSCAHLGNGLWSYIATAAESNYTHVAFTFVNTAAVCATIQIYTSFPQTGDNYTRIGAPAGASVSADIAAVKSDSAAIKTKTDFLPSATAGAAGGVFIAGSNAATSITTALTANIIGNVTGNLSGSVGSVTSLTASDVGAIKTQTDKLTFTVSNILDANALRWNGLTTVALPLVPTTAGRTLDVSAGGEAGVDWANVGSPTTSLALTGTTIATTQKVDVETIKTNPVVNAGTITFPTTATLASTTNITAGTITTTTSVTNDVGITQAGADKVWSTATRALTDKVGFALSAAGVQAIWDALTSALTTVGSIGKLLVDRLAVLLKLDTTMESTGSPTDYVFTTRALAQAPSGTGASAGTIAAAVWDEARAGHVAAGSFGEGVASVTGAVGSVTARVTANADQLAGQTVTAAAGVTFPTSVASQTNITAGTITTVTNLTNAPTAGDLTATMKASVTTAATAATPTVTAGTVSDKTGYALSTAGNAAVADKVLGRNLAGGSDGTRTVQDALRSLRNKTSITAGTLTVTAEDDTTPAWTAVVTTAPGDPLTSIDPA